MEMIRWLRLLLLSVLHCEPAAAVYHRPFQMKDDGPLSTPQIFRSDTRATIHKLRHMIHGAKNEKTRLNYVNSKSAVRRTDVVTSRDSRAAVYFPLYNLRPLWVNFGSKSSEEHILFYHHFNNVNLVKSYHLWCITMRRGISPTTLIRQIYYEQGTSVKIPCYRCKVVRWLSGRPTFFYWMNRMTMVYMLANGGSYYGHDSIREIFRAAAKQDQNAFLYMEHRTGPQLSDMGGYYLHLFPANGSARNELINSGAYFCMSTDETEPEVIVSVDFLTAELGDKTGSTVVRPTVDQLFTTAPPADVKHEQMNIQRTTIWSPWSPCCSYSNGIGRLYRSGYCAFKKVVASAPIKPPGQRMDSEFSAFDFLLTLAPYDEEGIRCYSSLFLELTNVFAYLSKIFLTSVRPVGHYVQQRPCNTTARKLVACLDQQRRMRLAGLTTGTMEAIEKVRTSDTGPGRTGERDVAKGKSKSCPPCYKKSHITMQVGPTSHVTFKLMGDYLFVCGSSADRKRISWARKGGPKLPTCFERGRVYTRDNELHIHSAMPSDEGTYWCRLDKRLIASLVLTSPGLGFGNSMLLAFTIAVVVLIALVSCMVWTGIIPDLCLCIFSMVHPAGDVVQTAWMMRRDMKAHKKAQRLQEEKRRLRLQVAAKLKKNLPRDT